ncbi:hypothetical protein CEXT_784971 [Caerostris extrusa]|uniref:Uncharacterized protein n=1 Tax=Caerostris extrusa TaxID=172846 RepID=A0AAV4S7D0_CAEEX|nr:hypothetical protein CEXT_784971 [Caerostris extrusa]
MKYAVRNLVSRGQSTKENKTFFSSPCAISNHVMQSELGFRNTFGRMRSCSSKKHVWQLNDDDWLTRTVGGLVMLEMKLEDFVRYPDDGDARGTPI